MRISYINIFLLIASVKVLVATPVPTAAQTIEDITVELDFRNASLKSVFQEIEKQTEFRFLTPAQNVNRYSGISLPTGTYTVKAVLDQVLAGTKLMYEQRENYVLVFFPEAKVDEVMKTTENRAVRTGNEIVLRITGTVTDANDVTLPGVSVVLKGTNTGTVTDVEGRYSIDVPDADAVLVFSSIGYVTVEMPVRGKAVIDVVLEEDVQRLDEIVVVGYGTQKKVNLTGSVVSIDVDEQMEGRAITDATQILAGLSAGVQVRQESGRPGNSDAVIRIRGVGTLNDASPLIIVDGIESSLSDLNPNDIQNISILKDAASASIYGSRAGNGVILVTTKKGRQGPLKLNYDGYASRQIPIDMNLVTNFTEHMRLTNEALTNAGLPATFDFNNPIIANWEENSKTDWRYPNTDWYDVLLSPAWSQNHNLSLSGGTEATTFLASAGYLYNPGVTLNAQYERYSARINFEAKALDWLTLGMNTYGNWVNKGLTGSPFGSLTSSSSPGAVPMSPDGRFGGPQAPGERFVTVNKLNPVYDRSGNHDETKVFSKFYSNIELFKGLTFESSFAIDFENVAHRQSQKVIEFWNFIDNYITHISPTSPIRAENRYDRNYRWVTNHLLRYSGSFAGVHHVDAIAGYTADYSREDWFEASIQNLIDETTTVLNAGNENPQVGGNAADRSLRSFFGRVNYNFDEKYLFEANLRYDGSSKFSDERKWGTFPSFSAGWRLSNEPFMTDVSFVDNLTLRASWGQLGNNRIGDYEYLSLYNARNYSFDGTVASGVAPGAIANPVISWEKTEMLNFGFLLNTFDNRLTVEFDWFNRKTRDILVNLPIPGVLGGLTAPRQNVGIVQNRGADVELGWRQTVNSNLSFGINGNVGVVRNEVLKFAGDNPSYSNQNILLEGHPIWTYFVRETDKMIRTQEDLEWVNQQLADGKSFFPVTPELGDLVYKDLNGDGIYGNDDDRKITDKSNNPSLTYGISAYVNWKGFDLSMLWQGVGGVYGYYWDYTNRSDRGNGWTYSRELAYDHWTPETPNATYPRLMDNAASPRLNTQESDFWLEDASYIKLKNIQIGYSLPRDLISKIGIANRLRIYASGENLLTLTDWPGMDPETVKLGNNQRVDPIFRQILFGVNVGF